MKKKKKSLRTTRLLLKYGAQDVRLLPSFSTLVSRRRCPWNGVRSMTRARSRSWRNPQSPRSTQDNRGPSVLHRLQRQYRFTKVYARDISINPHLFVFYPSPVRWSCTKRCPRPLDLGPCRWLRTNRAPTSSTSSCSSRSLACRTCGRLIR